MPRVTTIQTNFTAGEFSPRLYGRVDIDRYPNGAKTLENVLPLLYGGVRRRYGTLFKATAKNADKEARMIPFVFSTTQAYALEVGDQYMRFFTNGAQVLVTGVPYEIATPYTEAMLSDLEYVQSADTMFVFHEEQAIYRIRRFADDSWDANEAPFSVMPFDEIGERPAIALTLSAATVGTGRTVTAASAAFLAGDVGRQITCFGGTLTITGFTNSTVVTGDIETPFQSTAISASEWRLTESPKTTITPGAKDPVGASTTLTATVDTFRSTDVGKYVKINSGLVLITGFTSAQNVAVTIEKELSSTAGAEPDSWSLNGAVWNATDGYPRSGTLYQQRLIAAGSPVYPSTLWGSVSGAYLDFTLGTEDDDAFSYELASDQINPILHLVTGKRLIAHTYGGEFSIYGGVEKPVTPTNIQVDGETTYGTSAVKPIRIGKEIVYVDRSGLSILGMSYSSSIDAYDSSDITAVSEHVTEGGIVDMAFQPKPDPVLWAPRADGVLPSITFSREQNVVAAARQITDGEFESVCTIPVSGGYQTWAIVKRTINGSTVRYVEMFDPDILLDCSITGTSEPGAATWTGLDHLEAKTVQCLADGVYMGAFVVAGGAISLPRNAYAVTIGLPYTSTIELLPPEIQTGTGTAQANAMSTHAIYVRVLETSSLKINGKVVAFRNLGSELLDQAPPLFSGIKKLENLGWAEGESPIVITQDEPLPFHVQAVIRKFTVNDG